MKRIWLVGFIGMILMTSVSVPISKAKEPYVGYNYSFWGDPIPSPLAYVADRIVTGEQLGIGSFNGPQDIFVSADQHVYVLDSGNGRIVVLNSQLQLINLFEGFQRDGKQETFNKPQGLFVTTEGNMYVADTENQRLIELDANGQFVRDIVAPHADVLGDAFQFFPKKIALDKAKRIYVASRGVFDGIIQFDASGQFQTFLGANRVSFNPIDYFWKSIATKAQRAQMEQFVPIEYNNLDLDDTGFIYATSTGEESRTPIKRLNPSGEDILRREGYYPPIGDLWYMEIGPIIGPSRFIDVNVTDSGMYSALDNKRGRVFTYDEDGNLLYIFGVLGNQEGTFKDPIALEQLDDRKLLLDAGLNQITVFSPTQYGSLINEAVRYHYIGDEIRSAEHWREVVELDSNFDVAYIGIGKALLRQGEEREAAEYFKLGLSREYYSKAFQRYRQATLERNFGNIILVLILCVAVLIALSKVLKYRIRKKLATGEFVEERGPIAYVFYTIFHPFDGFWDLKYDNKARMSIAFSILFLVIVVNAVKEQYAGFVVNYNNPLALNSLDQVKYVLLPFFLWCVANWSLTTLMEGEGKFKEIIIGTAYSLTPLILINIPTTIWSNFMTVEESSFYYLLNSIAIGWFLYLFFVATMTVHQYSVTKTVVTIFLSVLAMAFIMFIGMLFFSLIQQIVAFVNTVYTEFVYRV